MVRVRLVFRYGRLLAIQGRASFLFALQYRWDFAFDGVVEMIWAASAAVPLLVVLRDGRTLGGYSFAESLVVLGWFTLLKAVLDGAISPSIAAVVEHVRKGTLDFVLLKPADAQFLVSTARFLPWRAVNVVTAFGFFVYAFTKMGRAPPLSGVACSVILLGGAIVLLYSLLVMTVSVAFYAVRVDNLTFLLGAIFDAARWPSTVFRGAVRIIFTFVIPLALMTTYPARALLGTLAPRDVAFASGVAGAFAIVARQVWNRAIGSYTSASS